MIWRLNIVLLLTCRLSSRYTRNKNGPTLENRIEVPKYLYTLLLSAEKVNYLPFLFVLDSKTEVRPTMLISDFKLISQVPAEARLFGLSSPLLSCPFYFITTLVIYPKEISSCDSPIHSVAARVFSSVTRSSKLTIVPKDLSRSLRLGAAACNHHFQRWVDGFPSQHDAQKRRLTIKVRVVLPDVLISVHVQNRQFVV